MRLRAPEDAAWNLELLGEHEGGTTVNLTDVRRRLAQPEVLAHQRSIGLLAIRRRVEGDLIGYRGLIVGRGSCAEVEIAYELLRRVHGHGYATEGRTCRSGGRFRDGEAARGPLCAPGTHRCSEFWRRSASAEPTV